MEEVSAGLPAIEAVNKLVEIATEVSSTHTMERASEPALQIREDRMDPRQHFMRVFRGALHRSVMGEVGFAKSRIALPSIGKNQGLGRRSPHDTRRVPAPLDSHPPPLATERNPHDRHGARPRKRPGACGSPHVHASPMPVHRGRSHPPLRDRTTKNPRDGAGLSECDARGATPTGSCRSLRCAGMRPPRSLACYAPARR